MIEALFKKVFHRIIRIGDLLVEFPIEQRMRFCGHSSFSRIDSQAFANKPLYTFTERERKPLPMLATGWGNQRIAELFGISRSIVKYHLKNLYNKLVFDDWMSVTLVRSERRFQR